MKKTKQIHHLATFAIALILVGAVALPAGVALAQGGAGTGTLTASGDGLAGVRGNGNITISGNGILWIRDHAGDASINVSGNGERSELPSGWIRYIGFDGQAQVSGSKVTVALSGWGIELEATGTGKFLLRGNGTYSTSRGDQVFVGEWSQEVEIISMP